MLELSGLVVRYGAIEAVRGVDLRVERGEAVALLGANGAGKTSLLRAVSGIEPTAAGRVLLDEVNVTSLRADARVRLGLVQVEDVVELQVAPYVGALVREVPVARIGGMGCESYHRVRAIREHHMQS